MSEATALEDHADEVILPIIALASGYNGAVISITKDLNLYVRNDGSDANDGYGDTGAHAFSTGTRAYEEAKRYVPSDGAQIIINLGPGSFAPIQAIGYIPGPAVIFRGDGSIYTSVVMFGESPQNSIIYADQAHIQVEHMKVGGNALGSGLWSTHGGLITVGEGMDFGSVAGSQLLAASGGSIYNYAPYTISGGGSSHMGAWGAGAYIEGGDATVTITAPITYTAAFVDVSAEAMVYNENTDYVGRELVTGKMFKVSEWGYIYTGNSGLNYFPGTIAGTWETGGRYDTMGGANQGPPGVAGPMGPKALSLQLPVANDEVGMFYAKTALTLTQLNAVVRGTTPGVVWSLFCAAARNNASPQIILANINTTSMVNNTTTVFTNPNIPANSWVWMKVISTSGVVLEIDISLQF
jgi:hypothetical protein